MAIQKICSMCRHLLPLTDFSIRKASKDGRQHRCKKCWRLDYLANREKRLLAAARRGTETLLRYRQRLAAYLRDHPCVDCGETDLRVLDFDHRDDEPKVADVTRLVAAHASWRRIQAEIEKCDVRCANCHRRRTAASRNDWRHQHHLAVGSESARRRRETQPVGDERELECGAPVMVVE
jgi:hypothetical protein